MRLLASLGLALAVVLLLCAPSPAAAGPCDSACQTHSSGCRKRCAENKKADPECLSTCAENARMCPQMCEIGRRNKGNPQKTQQEAKALYNRMKAKEQPHK